MVPVIDDIPALRHVIAGVRKSGQSVGLVPTMERLHAGHAHLIERCRAETGFVVVSSFVNPTQFGRGEDLTRYPRTPAEDQRLCAAAGADLIFAPDTGTMYPPDGSGSFVEVPRLSDVLEGACRPGHFRGVATVVLKLFHLVTPDIAYFGEKDFQQQLVIRRMVSDLNVPVEVRTVATVREADGLAMSSRNRYLDTGQRRAAVVLSRALKRAVSLVVGGQRDGHRLREEIRETVASEPDVRLEYAEVADAETLEPLERLEVGRGTVALVAARIGNARLIDNMRLI